MTAAVSFQMVAPHAYYGMPIYHQAQMQQQQIQLQLQQQQHSGFCSGAAAPTQMTPGAAASTQMTPGQAGTDLAGRDAANLCPDQTINQSNLKSLLRDADGVQQDATSDLSLNDLSSSIDSANEE